MNKKISIIIPAYNAEAYISRCLDSIVKQADESIEVIVVNDGSKDGTKQLVQSYSEKHSFIKLICQENGGVSSARNNGLSNAQGEFILFVDADDFFEDNAIKWFLTKCDETDCLWWGSFRYLKTRGRIEPCYQGNTVYDLQNDYIDKILDNLQTAPWGKLYNRDIIVKNNLTFPLGVPYGEDTIFLLNYLQYVRYVKTSNEIIYNYNFTDSGSAMWKFYPDFYKYMLKQREAKASLCKAKSVAYDSEADGRKFYYRCVNYYLLNSQKSYLDDVKKSFDVDENMQLYIKNWYKSNWKKFIKNKLKKLMM